MAKATKKTPLQTAKDTTAKTEGKILAKKLRDMNYIASPELLQSLRLRTPCNFWHYTRLKYADSILHNKLFLVNNLDNMNDRDELTLHKGNAKNLFVLCFSNCNTEQIPMWYLYSGISGKGAAIGLKPSEMKSFLKSLKSVWGLKVKVKTQEDIDEILQEDNKNKKELIIGEDVELQFGWVFYQKLDKKGVCYRREWKPEAAKKHFDQKHFEKDNFFLKTYSWEYEREFRLVFINRTETLYEQLLVSFEDGIRDSMMLKLAPEINKKNWSAIVKKFDSFKKLPLERLDFSNLDIEMNLFHRNRSSLADYIEEAFDPSSTLKELCKQIRECDNSEQKQQKTGKPKAKKAKT